MKRPESWRTSGALCFRNEQVGRAVINASAGRESRPTPRLRSTPPSLWVLAGIRLRRCHNEPSRRPHHLGARDDRANAVAGVIHLLGDPLRPIRAWLAGDFDENEEAARARPATEIAESVRREGWWSPWAPLTCLH